MRHVLRWENRHYPSVRGYHRVRDRRVLSRARYEARYSHVRARITHYRLRL